MTFHHPHSLTPRPSPLTQRIADDPAPGSREELAAAMLERLTGLSDQLRQTFTDRQWQSIPGYVTEHNYLAAAGAGAVLTVTPTFQDLVVIERVVVCVPAGGSATLRLGGRTFPGLAGGATSSVVAFACAELLNATDTRTLTLDTLTGGAGAVSVTLYGHQLAPTGSLSL